MSDTLKWFTFNQNNSGGSFDVDENVSHYVFIQAENADAAIEKAESFLDNSNSCGCCGNRWSFYASDDDGTDAPEIYGKPAMEEGSYWVEDFGRLHYADGRVEALSKPKNKSLFG